MPAFVVQGTSMPSLSSAVDFALGVASHAGLLAQAEGGAAAPAAKQPDGWAASLGAIGPFIPIILIGVLFYFLMLQPERKKQAEQKKMLSEMETNDQVVTVGGILGVVSNMTDKYVTLRVDDKSNAKIRVLRSSISRVLSADDLKEESAS
jgi:preprotein translocase subunit YajC